MDDWDSFIESISSDDTPIPLKQSTEKRYPCGQCNGTGLYAGIRVHQEKKQCFACRGKGYFKTDPRKLEKARQQRAKKKADAIEASQKKNQETSIYASVFAMAGWNDLARSLAEQHNAGRAWSEKQVVAIQSMLVRMEERRAQREVEAKSVNLQPIIDMFTNARDRGYKRPIYRAEGLKISMAPDLGRNAGALYVKTIDGEYVGKVFEGRFFPTREATEEHKAAVLTIAENPRDAAVRHGKLTGSCSCCGRKLTNKVSIEAGIGPICAQSWGLV